MKFRLLFVAIFLVLSQYTCCFQAIPQLNNKLHVHSQALLKVAEVSTTYEDTVVQAENRSRNLIVSTIKKVNTILQPVAAAALTGVLTSLLVLGCKNGILMIGRRFRQPNPVFAPIIASLVIGALNYFEDKAAIPAIDQIDGSSTHVVDRLIVRTIGFIVSIGSGFSVGLAGPAAEIGMALASMVNQQLMIKDIEIKKAIALAGSAAGLATNFNTPLTGLLFSSEVSARTFKVNEDPKNGFLKAISLAAALVIIRRGVGLPVPTIKFSSSSFSMFSSQQILAISGVGVVSGIVTLYVYLPKSRLKYTLSALCFLLFENIKAIINKFYEKTKVPNYIKPLFAGIVCSIAAYFSFPQTVSHGFLTTNQIIGMSSLSFNESRKFFLLKLYSFAWSNVSRIIGGVFAPLFFLGVGAGSLYTHILYTISPNFQKLQLMALVPLLAGASMISVQYNSFLLPLVFLLEMTQSFQIIVPVLIALISTNLTTQGIRYFKSNKPIK